MTISVAISPDQARELKDRARKLKVAAEDLAAAAVRDLLQQPTSEFKSAAEHVLAKNRELYRRLS